MSQDERLIAFVIYPGITLLDLIGSLEALLGLQKPYRTVVVARSLDPLESDTCVRVVPDRTLDDLPHPYGVIVPGGGVATLRAMADEAICTYLRSTAETAELVGSLGNGSLVLAAAGLLDGRQATTHWDYRQILERLGARYVQKRWVEDGKYITAGTTAALDFALYLDAKLSGKYWSRLTQIVIEYDPEPPFGGIDLASVDPDALPKLLDPIREELRQTYRDRPDLIRAVLESADVPRAWSEMAA